MVATPYTPPAARTNEPSPSCPYSSQNVSDTERMVSAIGGGALAIYGLSRGSLSGLLLSALGGSLIYRGLSGHCYLYQALGLNTAVDHGPVTAVRSGHGVKIEESITVNRPAADLYRYWINLENLPRIMSNLEKVERQGGGKSHWVAKAPLGLTVSWDAQIHTQRENELISWRSLPGSIIDTAGSVHFEKAPNGEGTKLTVSLKYDPPAGKVGATIARWLGEEPSIQVREDLQRFKQQMESNSNPAGVTHGGIKRI